MHERYSIQVCDDLIRIHGQLTVEETFDFLNFFEKKGYNSVILGSENSCIRMMKLGDEKKDNVTVLNEDRKISRPMTEEEKEIAVKRLKEMQDCHLEIPDPSNYTTLDDVKKHFKETFEEINKMRNLYPHLSQMDYYINPDPTKE